MSAGVWFLALPAALLVLALGAPVAALIASVSPAAAGATLAAAPVADAAGVSLRAACVATLLALAGGIPAGYLTARSPRPVRAALTVALAIPLAFPPVAAGVMLLAVVGNRQPLGAMLVAAGLPVVDRFAGVVLAQFFSGAPFVAIAAAAAFGDIDPRYEEAARTLGAGTLRIFAQVAVPLAARGIAAGALLAFVRAIGEYGATAVVAYHPTSLPIALYVALSSDGLARALAIAYAFAAGGALVVVAAAIVRPRRT